MIEPLGEPFAFSRLLKLLYHKKWVVYSKAPFNGAEGVLQYLGRYTHRVAISNNRIMKVEDDRVSFLWRDYSDGDKVKTMTLDAAEFIRRFLLHVLPARYVRIRHFGLLANRRRKDNIKLCREYLGSGNVETKKEVPKTWQEHLFALTGIDVTQCPVCKKGRMHTVEVMYPSRCNGPPVGKY